MNDLGFTFSGAEKKKLSRKDGPYKPLSSFLLGYGFIKEWRKFLMVALSGLKKVCYRIDTLRPIAT